MSLPLTTDVLIHPAAHALRVFAAYDSLRLRTYREGESLHSRISILSIGESCLLRFDDVGYFNRIYAADASVIAHIEDVERFYSGSPFDCELITYNDEAAEDWNRVLLRRRGWVCGKSYTWLAAPVERLVEPWPPDYVAVSEIDRNGEAAAHERFLTTYLSAFEADEARFPAAIRNMRHLFRHDSLRFLLASHQGSAVGVGMTYSDGDWTAFCAGATIPAFRNHGCHHALLAARVRLALAGGCRHVCSWAATGSQSQQNMMQAGLAVGGVTHAWVFRPRLATGLS